jgi:hypothetical protein
MAAADDIGRPAGRRSAASRYRALVRFGLDDGGLIARAERLQQRGALRVVPDLEVLRGAELYAHAVRDARRLLPADQPHDARGSWLRYFAYLLADYQWATLYGLAGEPAGEWWRTLRAVGAACLDEANGRSLPFPAITVPSADEWRDWLELAPEVENMAVSSESPSWRTT